MAGCVCCRACGQAEVPVCAVTPVKSTLLANPLKDSLKCLVSARRGRYPLSPSPVLRG